MKPLVRSYGVAVVAAAAFFGIGWLRWVHIRAGASDLGVFDQASWLMAHGRAPFVTILGVDVFADHVSPVIVVFAALYRIAATPVWLLGAQALALGLTIVPLRSLAAELGAPRWMAAVLTIASPALWSAAVYDFHPVVLATPAVAWALLAARRNDVRTATTAAIVVALCRADAVTALLGVAVVAMPAVRRRLLVMVPVPLVASVLVPRILGTWQTFDHYYRRLGSGWLDAAIHPWRVLTALVAPTSLLQILLWLLPLGFLPLRRPRWFAAAVVAGLPLLLSSWPGIPAPWYHHAAFLVPILIGGALAGWVEVTERATARQRKPARARMVLAVGAVVALLTASPWSLFAPSEVRVADVVQGPPHAWRAAVAAVGPTEAESTPNGVNGHLSRRVEAYNFPCPFPGTHGGRSCDHPNLFGRARHVAVVAVIGNRDLRWLSEFGRWRVTHHDGVTVARRVGTKRS